MQTTHFIPNPLHVEALNLYADVLRRDLYPLLDHHVRRIMAHPQYDRGETVVATLDQTRNFPSYWFRLGLTSDLVEDILCTPGIGAPEAKGMRAFLEDVARRNDLDAFVRDRADYAVRILGAADLCYTAITAMRLRLANHPAMQQDCLQVRFTGAPPPANAASVAFRMQLSVSVHEGWFKCPTCDALIPKNPHALTPGGNPICLACLAA